MLNAQLSLIGFEQELAASTTLDQCWEVLCHACQTFGFSGIELRLDRPRFYGDVVGRWHVHIDLPGHGYINLVCRQGSQNSGSEAILFINSIAHILNHKLDDLKPRQSELKVLASAD